MATTIKYESTEGATGTGIILDYAQTARAVPPNIEHGIQFKPMVWYR
jgi:hypothetical protein